MSAEFAARFPVLVHTAQAAALPSILRRGLISAETLCRLFGLAEADRRTVRRNTRPR